MESSRDTSDSTGQLSSAGSTGGGGGMHHSHSTPAGVDGGARTPPATPKKGGKMLAIRVQMLDDTVTIFQVQAKALGRVLFEQVCKQLHLLEADYFGLEYCDLAGTRYWLDLQKPISRQLGLSLVDPLLYFCVKFYTPDPGQLEEEYTRYLFCLQVKRDLAQGLMQCNDNTAALMASYIVQAECGDYVSEDYPDHTYLSSYKFVPQQDHEMERRIMENHKKHAGQSPAEADLNLLETARRCELYGMKMHPAKDHENVPLNLAVAHMGILVFQNFGKINTFSWAKIRKISFKRKRFLIKLHPEGYGYYKDTVEFFFEGRNECKNFWKKCVENHGFFRCSAVKNTSRHKTRVLSRGSSFRYSGKTQKQIVEFVRDNYVKRQAFQRSASFRQSSAHSSATNMHASSVGNSISAHPLLPLADSNLSVEVSKMSGSTGSMGATVTGLPASPTTKSVSRPRGTAMSWSSAPDTRPITQPPAQTMNSPSPPLTTQSASPATSATTSPLHTPQPRFNSSSSPVAVRAAVHRADTGTVNTRITTVRTMPFSHKSEGSLDHTNNLDLIKIPRSRNEIQTQTSPQLCVVSKRHVWQRSASCRELYDFSFEDSGQAKQRVKKISKTVDERKLESPITRYDDHRALYTTDSRNNSLEIHQDIMMPDQKVYSSSYPGTTSYSQESVEDPGNYDLRDSQDDLSHDSYELLERSDDDLSTSGDYNYRRRKINARSCSLDSGNYLPSDTDSDDKPHKCRSSSEIFIMDLPKEIIPRKSDGTFYKTVKTNSRMSSLESNYCDARRSVKKERSLGSRTSSQESKSEYDFKTTSRSAASFDNLYKNCSSSFESKSEYFDADSNFDRKIHFERNYGTQNLRESSHVHSISLQNVETEYNIQTNSRIMDLNTVPRMAHKKPDVKNWSPPKQQKSTESESNIFSFDEDRINILQDSVVPNIEVFRKESAIGFKEIEPRKSEPLQLLHQPIERTKSDPNSLARQRINSASRRLLLMHQKSIDLTPAESSDEDYLYRQIPSAPPITKHKGTRFEMPTAEFGHFDILKREMEGQKTQFEVPKRQFESLGAKTQFDFINLPPKNDSDIPYILHKRHMMNGTVPKEEIKADQDDRNTKKSPVDDGSSSFLFTQNIDLSKIDPVTLEVDKTAVTVQHVSSPIRDITRIDPSLFETLNSKLSQIESDSPTSSKTESLKPKPPVILDHHLPKIEPPLPQQQLKKIPTPDIKTKSPQIKEKPKTDTKPKRTIKPRMQPSKKGGKTNKTKVRITSFSSDDESLDSDDVFGSAEATPTKLEFSPPQMRKEMESILKFESERKYLQYTMSSTEVEGSPPTTRKKTEAQLDRGLEPQTQTELRRISERSFSIPSSEDDLNLKTADFQPVFAENDVETDQNKLDEEREREKLILKIEIEEDLKNLQVPPKTKITEIASSSSVRASPMLFAHARLNLSEGSAFSLLQKQQATESPVPGRRAKSLDAPVIPVNKLPPLNAFSSKDDTVEEEDDGPSNIGTSVEEDFVHVKPDLISQIPKIDEKIKLIEEEQGKRKGSIENDQIVPDVTSKTKKLGKPTGRVAIQKSKSPIKISPTQKPAIAKKPNKLERKPPLPAQSSLVLPEIKRAKSQEMEATKKVLPKEKAKSLEKLELKRTSSKERTKSQEESDTDIAKRKEKQQMLYEIAIKQSLKSPVKDILPVFPQVEEMVRERHGKLEISINTIENTAVPLEEAIIITKSPKKLDKKILDKKLTKSLELNLTAEEEMDGKNNMQRLGKSLDLDNRPEKRESHFEFDFKPPETLIDKQIEETSPESDDQIIKELVRADVHTEPDLSEICHDKVILEGTSLDVWLSVGETKKDKLENVQILKKSEDFFEQPIAAKPPDLCKLDMKSSSDSQSLERVSLGNSLDIKYIDDSGDSSHKSEKDAHLIAELQKASDTVGKFLRKKLEKRKKEVDKNLIHITSEESLTEVSELKCEPNLLMAADNQNKLSVERSRSDDTGSWVTVECEEYAGTEESFDNEIPEGKIDDSNFLGTEVKHKKINLLKRSSDQSRSSDTTGSWTSGEKDISPSGNVKSNESSVSCSLGLAFGVSQTIEKFASREQIDKSSPDLETPRSPRSPRICVLGRAFTIDEEWGQAPEIVTNNSSSEGEVEMPKDLTPIEEEHEVKLKKSKYPFEEKWSNDSELSQRLHEKIAKKLSSAEKNSVSSVDESFSDKHKGTLRSFEKLSTDSRNSLDTESSSGSLGMAARMQKSGDIPKELSSTWRPFPLESSGSSSLEEGFLPPDKDLEHGEYFLCRKNSGDFTALSDVCYKDDQEVTPTKDGTQIPDDLAEFQVNFGQYPAMTSEALSGYCTSFLSRTLSRISERSTNSEKSSLEGDSTKVSTQSDSLNDESLASSDPQASLSSDTPSNNARCVSERKTAGKSQEDVKNSDQIPPSISNLLQRQISDDRRTSAEMAELSMDDIEIITSERGLKLKRQDSDDTIIDEAVEPFDQEANKESSQSEEWPLPDIPDKKSLMAALHDTPSTDTSQPTTQVFQPPQSNIPRTFGLRGSIKSQDSEQWPSPPSSVREPALVGNIETYYITPPEEACKVMVDSGSAAYDDNNLSDSENKTEPDTSHVYENVAVSEQISESASLTESSCTGGVKIVVDGGEKLPSSGSNSGDDEVFLDTVDTSKNELRPPTAMQRRSTASDDSSHSSRQLKPPASHSSYSEEDCSSSNIDDGAGTVRYALRPTKCTHSSHSEDTSIALSLSEWSSNSANTVKFQNLSSNSAGTKSRSDDNSLTDIAHSISEWSSSNSTLKAQKASTMQFQKLSSGDSSTITELLPTISDWSANEQYTFQTERQSQITRLGSSIDEGHPEMSLKSPQNIPSEDLAALATNLVRVDPKQFTKSTERPIVIPAAQYKYSDSTESSSVEQSTSKYSKVPLKLVKCSPYYSSSLSSESTPLGTTSPVPLKTATVPLTRIHRKPISRTLFQTKSPPSENDSTSSVESPKNKPSTSDRRGYRRRRQVQTKKGHRSNKDTPEYNQYIRNRNMEEIASTFQYENAFASDCDVLGYSEALEEGYFPDGDSQSGSDIFRMERDEDPAPEPFDVSSIPPPLLDEDFEPDRHRHI